MRGTNKIDASQAKPRHDTMRRCILPQLRRVLLNENSAGVAASFGDNIPKCWACIRNWVEIFRPRAEAGAKAEAETEAEAGAKAEAEAICHPLGIHIHKSSPSSRGPTKVSVEQSPPAAGRGNMLDGAAAAAAVRRLVAGGWWLEAGGWSPPVPSEDHLSRWHETGDLGIWHFNVHVHVQVHVMCAARLRLHFMSAVWFGYGVGFGLLPLLSRVWWRRSCAAACWHSGRQSRARSTSKNSNKKRVTLNAKNKRLWQQNSNGTLAGSSSGCGCGSGSGSERPLIQLSHRKSSFMMMVVVWSAVVLRVVWAPAQAAWPAIAQATAHNGVVSKPTKPPTAGCWLLRCAADC
ncbi:GL19439 [Drosophila persimilis]|uniref:GL19439 n=1 Tax=Drosophila persimilis TaxID=7234 RepID=B4G997_DROPE|nr:GL19439 [Drosophila persimilis]